MSEQKFEYHPMFALGTDQTPYRKLTGDFVSTATFEGKTILKVEREAFRLLATEAYKDVSHLLRPGHLKQLARILEDPEASDNDRFVAYDLLKNVNIAAGGVLPMCQDTGTAIIMAKKDSRYGPAAMMKKPCLKASSRRSQNSICATAKSRLFRCMTKLTHETTCPPRSISTPGKETPTNFCSWRRVAGRRTRASCSRRRGQLLQSRLAHVFHGREDPDARHGRLSALSPGRSDRRDFSAEATLKTVKLASTREL